MPKYIHVVAETETLCYHYVTYVSKFAAIESHHVERYAVTFAVTDRLRCRVRDAERGGRREQTARSARDRPFLTYESRFFRLVQPVCFDRQLILSTQQTQREALLKPGERHLLQLEG
jgi:hypothetical protein